MTSEPVPLKPKKKMGRPRNAEPRVTYTLTLDTSIALKLNKLQGVYGKTRTAVMNAIVGQWLEAVGDEGIDHLLLAKRYADVMRQRAIEHKAQKVVSQRLRRKLEEMSGGFLDGDGNPTIKNT